MADWYVNAKYNSLISTFPMRNKYASGLQINSRPEFSEKRSVILCQCVYEWATCGRAASKQTKCESGALKSETGCCLGDSCWHLPQFCPTYYTPLLYYVYRAWERTAAFALLRPETVNLSVIEERSPHLLLWVCFFIARLLRLETHARLNIDSYPLETVCVMT